jgi:hypothetical protein
MATTSTRSTVINFTGDVAAPEVVSAAANLVSPAQIELKTFTGAGANTVTAPTGGSTPTAVTIIPPAGNVQTITLKGVTGDTGVALHLTDPTTIALAASVTTFVLTVGGTITGLRLVWS